MGVLELVEKFWAVWKVWAASAEVDTAVNEPRLSAPANARAEAPANAGNRNLEVIVVVLLLVSGELKCDQ